jgi:activator of 2-hydroxyglutaryl-CoA dehydratase
MIDAIGRRTGKQLLVPEDPLTIGALGAALIALEGGAT